MSEQLSFWRDDKFESSRSNKRLDVLKHIDIIQFIPSHVYDQYYQDTGRPPYALESMMFALLAQKLLKIPTIELLITVLDISPLLRRYCRFNHDVPDESTFYRFKQRLGLETFQHILDKMFGEANRLLAQEPVNPFVLKALPVTIRKLEVPVKGNRPKYFMNLNHWTPKNAVLA